MAAKLHVTASYVLWLAKSHAHRAAQGGMLSGFCKYFATAVCVVTFGALTLEQSKMLFKQKHF